MISPGYPQEMAYFTRGLAAVGARVIGVGDQSRDQLPGPARERRRPQRSTCGQPSSAWRASPSSAGTRINEK